MNKFYYSDGIEKYGPFTLDELRAHKIERDTLVWKEGMEDWKPANELSDFADFFNLSETPSAPPFNTPPRIQKIHDNDMEDDRPMPKNYLVESILVTFFCCLPLGIVGIVYAAKVESTYRKFGYKEAAKHSQDALKWVKLAFWIGLTIRILIFIIYFGFIAFMVSDSRFPNPY